MSPGHKSAMAALLPGLIWGKKKEEKKKEKKKKVTYKNPGIFYFF